MEATQNSTEDTTTTGTTMKIEEEQKAPEPVAIDTPSRKKDIVLPWLVAPILSVIYCDRAGIPHGVSKYRKAVTDPVDGREWTVSHDGGKADIIVEKQVASASQDQIFAQYDRLKESKAQANRQKDAYLSAYEKQKETDTPELRESTRKQVEAVVLKSDEADFAFYEFEQLHPECELKRLKSEAAYWTSKVGSQKVQVGKYEKACDEWQKQIDALPPNKKDKDSPQRDDNLQESLKSCKDSLGAAKELLNGYQANLKKIETAMAKIDFKPLTADRYLIPYGASVTFK